MLETPQSNDPNPSPGKLYFTIGEDAKLCDLKAHVLRYLGERVLTNLAC